MKLIYTLLLLVALSSASIPAPKVSHPTPELMKAEKPANPYAGKGCVQTAFDVKTNSKSFVCTDSKDRRFEIRVTPLFDVAMGAW